ncbi:extracellular mutant protein 11-domain-containing protein [Bombardia bombarda]|uniref:Extracellular mutant protein 11-domain-containing protein n=1 Tax=Bombardia bombarda TaxID=252184 RepID=A0AA40CGA6_9PEZI|nr:extracellular mutant protein 11-domain-containing protein [Bombardia bombarda]
MRLSMMPTAKKKLGGMSLFMRQADGSVSGPGSPRAGAVGLPASPAPAVARIDTGHSTAHNTGHTQLPQLQPPPEIVASRQLQIGRYSAASGQSQPGTSMSLPPAQHFHPMQRTRTSASDHATRDGTRTQNAWEDSTVGSMFGDNESRAASDRYRGGQQQTTQLQQLQQQQQQGNGNGNTAHGRHYSDAAYQRMHQSQLSRSQQAQHDENLPFVIGENGLLKVITAPNTHPQNGGGAAAAASAALNLSNGLLHDNEQTIKVDDVYQDDRPHPYETTPTKVAPLRRTKLPHRDARELKRNSFSDRAAAGYSSDVQQNLGMSPERTSEAGEQIEKVRLEERLRRDRERERERELDRERERELEREREQELNHKRSTVFESLTPIEYDEPTYNNTQAAVIVPLREDSSPDEVKEVLQRTPRATRQLQNGLNLNNPFTEGGLARTGSRRLIKPEPAPTLAPPAAPAPAAAALIAIATAKDTFSSANRKRRHSLDYNDAELNAMSYSDLRGQAFDYDPQAAALQLQQQATSTVPAGGTTEDKLEHYKTKGGMDQHQFFTRISADEWEDAGDWFLEQFTSVVQKMKKARREKRTIVERFEGEIAAREEAVRGKIEGIGRTLEDLKAEGRAMMQGKEVDLEF